MFSNEIVQHSVVWCRDFCVLFRGWRKGRGGCVRNIGHQHDFCQTQKAENTDPRTNYAVKYVTARGHHTFGATKKVLFVAFLLPLGWYFKERRERA